MHRPTLGILACVLIGCATIPSMAEESDFQKDVAPFLKRYCVGCHGSKKPKAEFSVHNLPATIRGKHLGSYEKIQEMVSIGDMPPRQSLQPTRTERARFLGWIRARLKQLGRGPDTLRLAFPKFGNRVNHEDLFSGKHIGPAFTPSRVWRINSHIYSRLAKDMELSRDFVPPLNALGGDGFNDYALLYADEATIRTMIQNGKKVAMNLVHGRLVVPRGAAERDPKNKPHRRHTRHRVLANFAALKRPPTREQMDEAVRYTFHLLLHREPSKDELDRYVTNNLERNIKSGGVDAGLRGFIVSMLMSPEFLFRMEIGLGKKLTDGRRMLSPHELVYALSFALYDHPLKSLLDAAGKGKLTTRADVAREVRRILDANKLLRGRIPVSRRSKSIWPVGKIGMTEVANPQLLRFFQEFFDYRKAIDVFKDDIRHGGVHDPNQIVNDADWFVLSVLAKDKNVLAELLTSDQFPVRYGNKKKGKRVGYATVYNLTEPGWPSDRPVAMPKGQRAGMLTHPAWLVAQSGNFENDPVRRGKWIQERLLAGVVPDIPIGVEAQLPDTPKQTLRQRFHVVDNQLCWRCHKKMNPLGMPFEIYDDFGRFRRKHHVTPNGRVLASGLEINRNHRSLTAKPLHPVDSGGELVGTGDPKLDGKVTDAVDLMHRLAKSKRVRQSFIRHVFRYWMGRNETLNDSPTLIAMDRAYVNSGGSFKETLIALLTSDSFLYRK